MAIETEVIARKYTNVVADTPVDVDFPCFAESEVRVYYGLAALTAVLDTDYTVTLNTPDYEDFQVTPLASLLTKINDLISADADEVNQIVVTRILPKTTDITPVLARFRENISTQIDRLVMIGQQLGYTLGLKLTAPANELDGPSLVIPAVIDRKNKSLEFGDDGEVVVGPTASGAVEGAEAAQAAAEAAQTLAETAQTGAETAQGLAEAAQTGAETAQGLAEAAQTGAETAETNAEIAQTAAEAAALVIPAPSALAYIRGNVGETAYETRTPSEVLADVGGVPLAGTELTAGYTQAAHDLGNSGTGTVTPAFANSNNQYIDVTGSFELAAPTGNGWLLLELKNDGTGGYGITLSGFDHFSGTYVNAANAVQQVLIDCTGTEKKINFGPTLEAA